MSQVRLVYLSILAPFWYQKLSNFKKKLLKKWKRIVFLVFFLQKWFSVCLFRYDCQICLIASFRLTLFIPPRWKRTLIWKYFFAVFLRLCIKHSVLLAQKPAIIVSFFSTLNSEKVSSELYFLLSLFFWQNHFSINSLEARSWIYLGVTFTQNQVNSWKILFLKDICLALKLT